MAKPEITRREFIKGIAAGAVSLATLGVLEGCEYSLQNSKKNPGIGSSGGGKPGVSGLTFTPGTYEATARGIGSDVKVTMTFDKTSITDVKIDVSGETPDIGGKIGGQMAEAILNAQSADVDAVSGATITADAVKAAAANCISQASGTTVTVGGGEDAGSSDWLGKAPEIAEGDIKETLDTEVLIVGCGTGGWIAAMTAAEEGAKVLVLEKREATTNIRHDIGAIGSKKQLESIAKDPKYAIDKMEALQEIVRYGGGYVDSDLIRVWADESAELVDWLTGILEKDGYFAMRHEAGVGNVDDPGRDKAFASGHSPETLPAAPEGMDTDKYFRQYCDSMGVEFRLNAALVKLEQDGSGKVTGAIAQDQADQHYIKITASKGVIMCAGGYASNTQMMQALQPHTLAMKINLPAGSTCDGSGIKAMMWAGAALDPTHASMMFNRACCLPTETAGYKTNGKMFWFGEQPFLKVNLNGKRFCNESGPYEFMLHSMYMQPNHTYCDIFDSNSEEYARQFEEVGCCRLFPFDNDAPSNRDFASVWDQLTGQFVDEGYVIKANTIEELAKGLKIPEENLTAAVKRYNELCAKGVDEDYGKEKHRLTPVDQPPFYGVRVGAWHLTTLNGCRINTDMQVIREDGTPIEGLWATGDCTGGFFAQTYPNLFTGLACGRTMTFGRHAAKIVAHL